ncbi:MAG: copper resistance protein B, partial [Brevundimonas sp.]
MIRLSVALLPLMLVAGPALAQSHAGHAPAVRAQAAPLPAGCVRRGAPDADPARTGTRGAPVCPTGSVPARRPAPAPAPHAGHAMPGMGTAPAAPSTGPHVGHAMPGMGTAPAAPSTGPHVGHAMSGMGTAPAAPSTDPHAGHAMPGMGTAPAAPSTD